MGMRPQRRARRTPAKCGGGKWPATSSHDTHIRYGQTPEAIVSPPAALLHSVADPEHDRPVEATRVPRELRTAEVILVVAVQEVRRIERQRELVVDLVACREVEPGLCLGKDGPRLVAAAGCRTDIEAVAPVISDTERHWPLLVDSDQVVGIFGDVLERALDVGSIGLEAQAVERIRQESEELRIPQFYTVDVARRRVERLRDLINDSVDGFRRDGAFNVAVDLAIEHGGRDGILPAEIILKGKIGVVGFFRAQAGIAARS